MALASLRTTQVVPYKTSEPGPLHSRRVASHPDPGQMIRDGPRDVLETHPAAYLDAVLVFISLGAMFWLWWKTLSGSYLAFTSASRR